MKRAFASIPLALLSFVSLFAASAATTIVTPSTAHAAACAAPSTDYGTVTSTATIQTAGTYHIWSRMAAPNSGSNSYMLEVTNNGVTNCFTVTGNANGLYSGTPATHFQSGNQNWTKTAGGSNITMSLTASSTSPTTIKMIGTSADVYLDRVVMTTDANCTPTGTGDNCANPPDTTPPAVNITSPTGGSVNSPVTVNVNATEPDGGIVSSVALYVDDEDASGTPVATDSNSPYSFAGVTLSIGTHTLTAKATNASGYSSLSTPVTVTVNDSSAPTGVSITSPTNNSAQSGTITVTAGATDNVGVSRVEFLADGTEYAEDVTGPAPFTATLDTTALSNASHNLTVRAYDAAGNSTVSSTVAITVNNSTGGTDTTGPTVVVPTSLSVGSPIITGNPYQFSGINISDASGIGRIDILVDGAVKATRTSAPFNFELDTSDVAKGTRSVVIRVTDNSTAQNVTNAAAFSVRVTEQFDVNRDCRINIGDIVYIGSRYTNSGSGNIANVNGDSAVNIGDIVYVGSRYTYSSPTSGQRPNPCTP